MEETKVNYDGSMIFILYKNKKQTLFRNIDKIFIEEDHILLRRSSKEHLTIHMGAVEYYKVY